MLTWALATIFIVAAKNQYELEINGGLLYFTMLFDVAIIGGWALAWASK